MIQTEEHTETTSANRRSAFAVAELDQAIDTYRQMFSLVIQISTVLVIADVTVVGFSITTQIAGVLLSGVVFPVFMIYLYRRVHKLSLPVIYTAVSLERKYGGEETDWLASTFTRINFSSQLLMILWEIAMTEDPLERAERLHQFAKQPTFQWSFINTMLAVIAVAHVIAPLVLTTFFGWRLF